MSKAYQGKGAVLTIARNAEVYLLMNLSQALIQRLETYLERLLPITILRLCSDYFHYLIPMSNRLDDVISPKTVNKVHETAESLREKKGQSIDKLFREVFKC